MCVAGVAVPAGRLTENSLAPCLGTRKRIVHTGEINRLRSCPKAPHLVLTHSDSPSVFVWNTNTQPDGTPPKDSSESAPVAAHVPDMTYARWRGGQCRVARVVLFHAHNCVRAAASSATPRRPRSRCPSPARALTSYPEVGRASQRRQRDVARDRVCRARLCATGRDKRVLLWSIDDFVNSSSLSAGAPGMCCVRRACSCGVANATRRCVVNRGRSKWRRLPSVQARVRRAHRCVQLHDAPS